MSTLWCSWVLQSPQHTIFFGGDSGYSNAFRKIGEKFGPFTLTMLECGAYSEHWPAIHIFPEQTAQAHVDLRGEVLLPVHWAKFNLSLHAWTEPIERLLQEAKTIDIKVATPKIGERFSVDEAFPQSTWWREVHK